MEQIGERRREVASLLSQAEDLIWLDRSREAIDLIAQALRVDPASEEAQRLLDDLAKADNEPAPPAPGPFEGATALLSAGYDDEAREQARKVATEKGLDIPEPLQKEQQSETKWLEETIADIATWASGAAIVGVLIAAFGGAMLKFLLWLVRRRKVTLGAFNVFVGFVDAGRCERSGRRNRNLRRLWPHMRVD